MDLLPSAAAQRLAALTEHEMRLGSSLARQIPRAWSIGLLGVLVASNALAVDPQRQVSQLVHKQWTAAEGLSAVGALAVAQTPEGYIWIGTEDGLSRFDGREFVNFSARNQQAFADATLVWDLAVGKDGSLWIATDAGLVHHRVGGEFEKIDGLSSKDVRNLAIDDANTLWAGTSLGLDAVREERVVATAEHRAAGKDGISALHCDSDGTLWLGSADALRAVSGSTVHRFGESDGLPRGGVTAITRDHGGALWVGVGPTLVRKDGERFVPAGKEPTDKSQLIRTLFSDSHDALWVGRHGSLDVVRNGTWVPSDPASPLAGEEIRGAIEDREGNLWVVGHTSGLHMLHDGAFQMMIPEGLKSPLLGVLEGRDGAVWMGAYEGGLFRMHGREAARSTTTDGIPPGAIWALHEDLDGTLWVGGNGLAKSTGGAFVAVESDAHGDPSTLVTAITRTNGGLWIGQLGRGAHLRGADGTTRWVHASDGLPSDEITRILEARDGTLWIGTRAGLAREREGRFETIKIGDGTHNPTISDLEEDEDGNVWIAAFGGLARAKGSHADAFPPSAGFPFLTTSVALDGIGNVWVGTSTGVCRIPRSEFERFLQSGARPRPFRCFDESDGFRNRETDMGGRPVAHFRDGRLGFATVAGLAVVHPEKVTSEGLAPLIDIQQVEADGVALGVAELRTLAPGTRQLRVDYAALTYVAPNRVRHRYRLEGYDRDWVDAGNRRSAHYTNIPPGTYRFVVTAENGRGVWNETGASFRIQQRAHFYQTVPFYLSAAGLLLGGALAAYGLRVRQLKRIAAVLEKRVEERTVALRSALVQLEEKDARLHSDLMQARSFQRAMLSEVPGNESVQFTTLYQPTELIGGDIYDIAEMPWGGFRILLADTTGHGVQASLRTMVIKTEYDRLKATCRRPSELLGALNRALAKFPEGSVSCSGCCIDIHGMEAGRSRVVYANAAHPEVLHRSSAADTMGGLYLPSMYLGILEDCEYSDLESEMLPGDWLLLYSDGAIEEVNADGVMFGEERLREAFRDATSRTSGTEAALAVRRAITRFTGRDEESALTADDMMLLLVELRPRADT